MFCIAERNEGDIETGYPFVIEEVDREGNIINVITSLEEIVERLNEATVTVE